MAKRRANGEGSIFRRKDGRWAASALVAGERRSFYGRSREEAASKLLTALTARRDGMPLPRETQKLAAFLESWLETAKANVRPLTFKSYAEIVRLHVAPVLGKVVLARLTPQQVQGMLTRKLAGGLSARRVQYIHAVIRAALGQAERWGLVARNVAKLVKPPRVRYPEVKPLTTTEARSFLEAVRGDRLEALYAVALALGLRQGEVLGLSWDDIDLAAGTLAVRHTLQRHNGDYHLLETKTMRSRRTIALAMPLLAAIRAHRSRQLEERLRAGPVWQNDARNLVFTMETGGPLYGGAVTRHFQAILERAGLPRQRFHDLRHAAASFMLAQGVPLRVVMEVLGHSQIAVTANIYAHVAGELQREATERVSALLWAEK